MNWKDKEITEERIVHLEEVTKTKALRTCHELAKSGVTLSGDYFIDPDGELIGHEPIMVFCDFESGTTQVRQNKEFNLKIDHCDQAGCAQYDIDYSADMEQIQALIDLSESCTQSIDFGCFLAPLAFENSYLGWWTAKHGTHSLSILK